MLMHACNRGHTSHRSGCGIPQISLLNALTQPTDHQYNHIYSVNWTPCTFALLLICTVVHFPKQFSLSQLVGVNRALGSFTYDHSQCTMWGKDCIFCGYSLYRDIKTSSKVARSIHPLDKGLKCTSDVKVLGYAIFLLIALLTTKLICTLSGHYLGTCEKSWGFLKARSCYAYRYNL